MEQRDDLSVQPSRVMTIRQAVKDMRRFITFMCILGPAMGLLGAFGYKWVVDKYAVWDMSKDSFHFGIILYGLGVTFPILSISVRLMVKMFFQNCEAIENQNYLIEAFKTAHEKAPHLLDNVQKVMDKAVPIADNLKDVIAKGKEMSDDVQTVAHKIRGVMDAMNGSFSADTLGEIRDSLKKIADGVSAFKLPTPDDIKIPEFDPLKPKRHRESASKV